jgi:hypothetical protein
MARDICTLVQNGNDIIMQSVDKETVCSKLQPVKLIKISDIKISSLHDPNVGGGDKHILPLFFSILNTWMIRLSETSDKKS